MEAGSAWGLGRTEADSVSMWVGQDAPWVVSHARCVLIKLMSPLVDESCDVTVVSPFKSPCITFASCLPSSTLPQTHTQHSESSHQTTTDRQLEKSMTHLDMTCVFCGKRRLQLVDTSGFCLPVLSTTALECCPVHSDHATQN